MTARLSTLSHVKIVNKLLYNYFQAVCKKEDDWSSHLVTIELGHNPCSVTGSRYFYLIFVLQNVTLS